jgi:hypothetical protein
MLRRARRRRRLCCRAPWSPARQRASSQFPRWQPQSQSQSQSQTQPQSTQSRFHHHHSPARPLPRPLRCTANLSCAASLYDCRLQPFAQPAPDRGTHPWSHLAQRASRSGCHYPRQQTPVPAAQSQQPSPSRPSLSRSFQASCACVPPKSRLPACIAPQVLSPAAS